MQCPCGYGVFGRDQQVTMEKGATRWRALTGACCDEKPLYRPYTGVEVWTGLLSTICLRCRRVRETRVLGGGTALEQFYLDGMVYVPVSDVASPDGVYARLSYVPDPSLAFDVPARLVPGIIEGGCVVSTEDEGFLSEEGDCVALESSAAGVAELTCFSLVDNAGVELVDEQGLLLEQECDETGVETCYVLADAQDRELLAEDGRPIEQECYGTGDVLDPTVNYIVDAESAVFGTEEVENIFIDEVLAEPISVEVPPIAAEHEAHLEGAVFADWCYELPVPPTAPRGAYGVTLFDRYLGRAQVLGVVQILG